MDSPTLLKRLMTGVAAGLVAAGLVLLLASVGVAVWSQNWATSSSLPVRNIGWDSSTPGRTAWVVGIVAVLVLAAVTRGVRRGDWVTTLSSAAVLGSVLIGYGAMGGGLVHNYTVITTGYSAAQAVPAILAAWLLAVGGAAAVAGGAVILLTSRPGRVSLAVGAALGVVVAVVVAFVVPSVVMRDADPSRHVDATVAEAVATPPTPVGLGTLRFTIQVADAGAVVAAGPGFVARTAHGVRAFDAAGKERWHFLHAGDPAWKVTSFHVFDGGATIVMLLDSGAHEAGEAVALDAMTGRLLWRTDDSAVVVALSEEQSLPLYLLPRTYRGLERIDTRTGESMWVADSAVPYSRTPADTEVGVGFFTGGDDHEGLRYVSLDPQTGAVRLDVVASSSVEVRKGAEVVVTHAGRNGVVFSDVTGARFYLDAITGAVTPFDAAAPVGTVATDDFVARTPVPTLRGAPDGRSRCLLPASVAFGPAAWLDDQVLGVTAAVGVTAYRRSDCAPVPATAPPIPAGEVIVAPGAVLVVEAGSNGIEVRGYA